MSNKLSDRIWIWGHPEDSFNEFLKAPPAVEVTPAQGMRYLGAKNVFYVPFGHPMDLIRYSKDLEGASRTGLSVERWGDIHSDPLEKTFGLAGNFKNIDRMVYDDFFNNGPLPHIKCWNEYSIPDLVKDREKIHNAGLEMWVVLYQHQLDMEIDRHLQVFDGVSFWFWNEPSKEDYHQYSAKFLEKTAGKKHLIGCYLYNFGLEKEAAPELVKYQMDHNLELVKQGELEGIVLHNNALGGYGFAAYKEAKKWMDLHADMVL